MFSIKPFPVVVRKCSVYNSSLAARNECVHISRGRSRAAATSKIECFVLIANGFQPLTIITKHSILDVAAALDPPLLLLDQFSQQIWQLKFFVLTNKLSSSQAPCVRKVTILYATIHHEVQVLCVSFILLAIFFIFLSLIFFC